jgi:hypothetical protein
VEGVVYPVTLEDLPARVESFKTLDDTNLVKTADVGQARRARARWLRGPGGGGGRLGAGRRLCPRQGGAVPRKRGGVAEAPGAGL